VSDRDGTAEHASIAELSRNLAYLHTIIDSAIDTILVLDEDLRVVMVSGGNGRVSGIDTAIQLGPLSLERVHPDDRFAVEAAVRFVFQGDALACIRYRFQHADGHWLTLESNGQLLDEDDAPKRRAVFVARDVTQNVIDQGLLSESFDMKMAVFNSAADVISVVNRELIVVETNPRSSHFTGVQQSERIGQKVTAIVHPMDVVLLTELLESAFAANDGETRTASYRVLGHDGQLYVFDSRVRTMRDSNGMAELAVIISSDGTNAFNRENTLREDLEARDAILEAEHERVTREISRVQEVLDQNAIVVVFQPVVELQTGSVVGFEALSRFSHEPVRPPNVWFAEAGRHGMGADLEFLALRTAFQSLSTIPSNMFLTVNLSPLHMLDDRFIQMVSEVDLSRVVIELTEHEEIWDYAPIRARMEDLRLGGAQFAVDDAGSGFASLQHILKLAPEWIKLDIALVSGIDEDPARRSLAASLVYFADEVKTSLIGEGVETESEKLELIRIGVKNGQGFHLGRPGPLPVWP
jgi:PAS domain S-box-containing protein